MNDALEKFLMSAPDELKLIWKTLKQYNVYCFGGFWRHECNLEYLYNDGDLDIYGNTPIYKLKRAFLKTIGRYNFTCYKNTIYNTEKAYYTFIFNLNNGENIRMDYINELDVKKADFLSNAVCYHFPTGEFTCLPLHSNPEPSDYNWELSDSIHDIKNKKLRSGGRLLIDYCSRPFHRIVKMYERGFKIDLLDSETMHYVKKVLSNDSTCPYNLNIYSWDLLYEVFYPLIKTLLENHEYCYKLYFNQLLMDVLYDFNPLEMSIIFKQKMPIYDEDIEQMLLLSEIDMTILDKRFLNYKPSLFLLKGEQNSKLAVWIINNLENIPLDLSESFLCNLASEKRFDLIEKLENYNKQTLGCYGLHQPWITKNKSQENLKLILETPLRKHSLECFLKLGIYPNEYILCQAFENGKLKIAEYCLSNLDISNIKLQEILDNAEVATWADLKDWKILIDTFKKKITLLDLLYTIDNDNEEVLPYLISKTSRNLAINIIKEVDLQTPKMMYYFSKHFNLAEINTILKDVYYQTEYNIDFLLAKKNYPKKVIECMRSYIWGFF